MAYNTAQLASEIKSRYPEYGTWPDDHLVAEVVSKHPEYESWLDVSSRARLRLAKREGLTPEQIKADPSRSVVSPDKFTTAPAKTTDRGFWGEVAAAINPKEIATGIVHGVDRALDAAQQFTVMGTREPTLSDVTHIVPANPVAAMEDAARESYRRGEANESTAGMYGGVTGSAALMAAGEVLPRIAPGVGAKIATNAERTYTKNALGGGPLAETMAPQMMDRGIVPRPSLAPEAEAAAARASTEAATYDAMREAVPPATATEPATFGRSTQRRELATARDAASAEADFQRNLQTITEGLPESKELRNVLIDGAKRGTGIGVGGTMVHALPGGKLATAAAGAYQTFKTLNEIRQTPFWNATLPIWKRNFAKAMQSENWQEAADIGARIMGGSLLADDFGHVAAVRQLAQESEPLGSPELRRQMISTKRAYYNDPEGQRITVPQNVVTAMANSKQADEFNSPLAAWLNAMAKQGKLKKGGRIEFSQ